jgi:hypothetical protein
MPLGRHHTHSELFDPHIVPRRPSRAAWLNQRGSFPSSFVAGSSDAGFGVTSTVFSFARSTRSITRRMVSKGIPPSAEVRASRRPAAFGVSELPHPRVRKDSELDSEFWAGDSHLAEERDS